MHGVFWNNGFMELGSSFVTKVLVVRTTGGNNLKNFCEFYLKMAVTLCKVKMLKKIGRRTLIPVLYKIT